MSKTHLIRKTSILFLTIQIRSLNSHREEINNGVNQWSAAKELDGDEEETPQCETREASGK